MKKLILSSMLLFGVFQIATAQLYDTSGTKQYSNNRAPIKNNTSTQDGSYCQMIYTPSDVAADTLFGIQFEGVGNLSTGALVNSLDWEVWIGETSQSSFGQYITTGITKVFDGVVKLNGNKVYVYFDNYHIYSGTQNLVVGIVEKTNGQSSPSFWQSNVGTASLTRIRTFNPPATFDALNPNTGGPTYDPNPGTGGQFGRPFTEFIISEPCETPTNIVFSDIKQSSASISFDSLNAADWDISYLNTPGGGGTVTYNGVTTSQNFNLTSLNRFSNYPISITANCGAFGTSEPATADLLTRRCDSVHTSVNESFDIVSGGPAVVHFTSGCWSVLGGSNPSYRNSSPTAQDGSHYIRMASSNDYIVLPYVEQVGTGTLSFWANPNSSSVSLIRVGVLTDPKDASSFVSLRSFSVNGFGWQNHTVDFSNYISQAYDKNFIAIKADANGMNFDLIEFNGDSVVSEFVQDFETITPFQGVNEEGWVGYLGTATGNHGSLTFGEVTPSSTTFSGVYMLNIYDDFHVSYLTSPKVSTSNQRLKFAARKNGISTRPIYVGTINSIAVSDTSSFVPIDTIFPTSNFVEYTVDLSNSNAVNGHIAFKMPSVSTNGTIQMDLIEFGQPDFVVNDSLCDGDSIVLSNQIVRTTGMYLDTLMGSSGDSIVQYNATFFAGSNDTLYVEICDTVISPSGKIWTTGGTFYDTIPTAGGCDSLFTYILTPSISPASVTAPSFCLGDSLRVTINPSDTNVQYTFRSADPNVRFVGTPVSMGNGGALTLTSGDYRRDYAAEIVGTRMDSTPPKSIEFGGTADRLQVPVPSAVNYNNGYSVQGWVKTTSNAFQGNGNRVLFQLAGNSGSDVEMYIQGTTGDLLVVHNRSNGGTIRFIRFPLTGNTPANWFQFTVTYDGSIVRCYLNGNSTPIVSSGNNGAMVRPVQSANSTAQFADFKNNSISSRIFNGSLDELRFWDKPLTAQENSTNYNQVLSGNETDLAIYLDLQLGSGNVVTDQVSNTTHSIVSSTAQTLWGTGIVTPISAGCMKNVGAFNIDVDSVNTSTTQSGLTLTATATGATYQWYECTMRGQVLVAGATNQSFTPSVSGSYAVEITENGCIGISNCVPVIGVGIDNVDLSNTFKLYPNPTNGWINIQSEMEIERLSFYSMEGRLVKQEFKTNKSNMSDLKKGVYFVEIETTKGTVRKKLVKQ